MDRLIDAKDFDLRVAQRLMTDVFPNWIELPTEIQDMLCEHGRYLHRMLETQPTVDAVKVVHGHWHVTDCDSGEPEGYAAFIEVHCSECGYELGAENGEFGWTYGEPFPLSYCPNCGAKMDGEENR